MNEVEGQAAANVCAASVKDKDKEVAVDKPIQILKAAEKRKSYQPCKVDQKGQEHTRTDSCSILF